MTLIVGRSPWWGRDRVVLTAVPAVEVVRQLRAGDVPSGFRWTLIHYYAHPLPESATPTAPCQVDHALVCPRSPTDLTSPALQRRRLLNETRRRRAEELFAADPTDAGA
ncbi:DUF6083 domain-containing protein [Streptomyces sp. NPDC088341]|uniref:DUF6083 domain-containing protein n=1 Tax=Streptomyces sp. NPDC088341 TaxID=3154870 RepID=UPI00342C2EA2